MRSSEPARRSVSSSCVHSDLALKACRAVVWFLSPRVDVACVWKVRAGWRVWRREATREVCARARAERRVPMWMVVGAVGSGEGGSGEESGGACVEAASGAEGEERGGRGGEGSVAIGRVMWKRVCRLVMGRRIGRWCRRMMMAGQVIE